MTFNTQSLMDNRVLVTGTDLHGSNGKTIVDSTQWVELNQRTELNKAQLAFDDAVEEFFAPLVAAAEAAAKSVDVPTDSLSYVVLDEGSDGSVARPANIVSLNRDSIILRLIEEGNTDRLVWIGDTLEILAAQTTPATPVAVGPGNEGVDPFEV